jgi:Xaa-Pro aminopeptidase
MSFRTRIQALQRLLPSFHLDALVIEDAIDLFYLTGLTLSAGTLLLSQRSARLFVDGRYYEDCLKRSPCPVTLTSNNTLENYLKRLKGLHHLGFDSARTSYARSLALKKIAKTLHASLKPVESPLSSLRILKDAGEIQTLRKAAKLGSRGFEYVCSQLKVGITEAEIARKLQMFWLDNGGDGIAFEPIIAFGKNSSKPHYRPSAVKLQKNQAVLIDIGVTLNHYHSDMTRTVFFGKPPKKMVEIYTVVKAAQEAALKQCKPGISVAELDATARRLITDNGYGQYFSHGLGHGVGLEIHEAPSVKDLPSTRKLLLKPGMVITIEPGVYLPNVGGVRIEDTIVITDRGYSNLSTPSKEIISL